VIEIQHSAEPPTAMHYAVTRDDASISSNQAIVQTLMIAFFVVQVDILIPISSNREKCGSPGILGTASGYGSMRDL